MSTRHIILYAVIALCVMLIQSLSAQQTPFAASPPMGWNSWNRYACDVSDALIRKQADAMVNSGLKAAGYQYVNVDDCWEGQRDTNGYIQPLRDSQI
jgi:alpha-galactosidase